MEFGELFFEDKATDNDNGDNSVAIIPLPHYVPKDCSPEWFINDDGCHDDDNDDTVILKYKADSNYYKADYRSALSQYKQLIEALPLTHSQLKREVLDSIVRCCIKCEMGDEALQWCRKLVLLTSDHSSMQLMADCYTLIRDTDCINEVIHRLKCVLLSRHFPNYWAELHQSFTRLINTKPATVNADILDHTSQLLRPYFNKQEVIATTHPPAYQSFIKLMTTPTSCDTSIEEYLSFLHISLLCINHRTEQLVRYTVSNPLRGGCGQQAHDDVRDMLSSSLLLIMDTVSNENIVGVASDSDELKGLIHKHMQTPFEIDI